MKKLKMAGAWLALPVIVIVFLVAWAIDGPEEHTEDY